MKHLSQNINIRTYFPQLLLLPGFLMALMVYAYPLLYNVILSLHHEIIIRPEATKFVGLSQYWEVFNDPKFWYSLKLSGIWIGGTMLFIILISLGLALLLNQDIPGIIVFRALFFLPWIVPDFVAVVAFRWLYDTLFGPFNYFLLRAGLISSPLPWLASPDTAMLAVIILCIWKAYPFVMLILLAGLQSISPALYECATIDGANIWQKFFFITIPQLKPILIISNLLMTLWIAKTITLIYVATQGGPIKSTSTLPIHIYNTAFLEYNFGKSATLSLILVIFILAAIYPYFYLRREAE